MLRRQSAAVMLAALGAMVCHSTAYTNGSDEPCTLVVDARGPAQYRTIQSAVDALPNPGPCHVIVRPGVYGESVIISGRNTLAASDDQRIRIEGDSGAIVRPPGDHAFTLANSAWIEIAGFVITGAARDAIVIASGDGGNHDVTIARTDLHNNGSAAAGGGVLIEPGSTRTWVVNNLIRQNGRNGIVLRGTETAGAGSIYVVNNTVFANGWSGVTVDRNATAVLVNNLVVGNGAAPGSAGGRWGITRGQTAGPGKPADLTLVHNVLYANGAAVKGAERGDLGNAAQMLDDRDSGNLTTTGTEGQGIEGCVFPVCNAAAPFLTLFGSSGYGPTFGLVAGSPAIGAGVGVFEREGKNWVPGAGETGSPVGAALERPRSRR
jgi:hypothetical protein